MSADFFFSPPISPSQILMNLLLFSKCAAFIYNNNSTQHSLSRAMFSGTAFHYLLLLGSSVLNSRPPATWREFSKRLWRALLGLNWNVFVQNMADGLFTSSVSGKSPTLVSYWLHSSGFPKNIKCYLQTKHAAHYREERESQSGGWFPSLKHFQKMISANVFLRDEKL